MKRITRIVDVLIFLVKIVFVKILHPMGFHIVSKHSFFSRCKISTKFRIIGDSKMVLGQVGCAEQVRLSAVEGGELVVGNSSFFNSNCVVVSRGRIVIGNKCTFGPNVCIYDHDHVFSKNGQTGQYRTGRIEIGENCWFGAGSIVLRDTIVGNNCVIGAGCVLKGVIPDNSLVQMERDLIISPLHD